MRVDVEPWMRTAAAVAWEAAAKISLLVLALSLLDRGYCSRVYCGSTGCCSSTCCCCAAAVAAGVVAAREGGGPQEAIRPSSWWSRIVSVGTGYLCAPHGSKAAVTRNPDGKNNEKPTTNVKTNTPAYAHVPFRSGKHMGRPTRQIHGPAHVIVGPAHIEPVSHRSRCHVMGRAGPRPIL